MRRIAAALVVAAVAVTLAGARPALAGEAVTDDESRVLAHVGQVRSDAGAGELAVHPDLMAMARRQTARMVERGEIFHNERLTEEITDLGVNWKKVGENVGVGPNLDDVGKAFVASDVHYENIVNRDFNAVGVGVAKAGDAVYVTHVFAQVVTEKAEPAPEPRDTEPKAEEPTEAPKSPQAPPATKAPKPEPKPDPTPDAPESKEEPERTTAPKPATPEPEPVTPEPVSSAVSGGVVDRSWSL